MILRNFKQKSFNLRKKQLGFLLNPWRFGGGSAPAPYDVGHSLRFRASGTTYLSQTPPVAGNRRTWTWVACVKRGSLGANRTLFSASNGSSVQMYLMFTSADVLEFVDWDGVAVQARRTTNAVFRDPNAHMQIMLRFDTTQATAGNRVRLYVDGTQITSFSTSIDPALNYQGACGSTIPHAIGREEFGDTSYFDGYLSIPYFIDGLSVDPGEFGESVEGVWVPKAYTGAYGTNGSYLPFNNATSLATLTADASGNGNNWTSSGHSLTAGVNYDWMEDTPTNNFPVLNPLYTRSASTASAANLNFTTAAALSSEMAGTMQIPESGKWYWECVATAMSSSRAIFGVGRLYVGTTYAAETTFGIAIYSNAGEIITNNTVVQTVGAFVVNDVIGIAVNKDAGEVSFYKNGTLLTTRTFSATGLFPLLNDADNTVSVSGNINFGQRPFAYTPPTGFLALCTKNLPTPAISSPSEHFQVKLDIGANIKATAEAVFPSNFLEWIKDRANANNHQLIDTVRGASAVLQSNTYNAETTYSTPTGNSVAWVWKAGGAAVTNTDGSITSQVSVNTTARFSIVTYTGNSSTGVTIGHGLGVAPKMIITRRRDAIADCAVWHSGLTAVTGTLYLDLTVAQTAYPNRFDSTGITSSVFKTGSIGLPNEVNASGGSFVAYCFAEVEGFSRIGTFTTNGSTDNAFVYCGFRPRFILFKRTDAAEDWTLWDTARDTYNVTDSYLIPNASNAEGTSANLDILSNGFKLRAAYTNGAAYIFIAFAEAPFKYARAR